MFRVPDLVHKVRHEFHKSPPCKAGFCISGDLLGGLPPSLDQFHQHLAAATQAAVLFELVDETVQNVATGVAHLRNEVPSLR